MKILTAVAYARFSSDNQRSESIDAQMRAMEAYCKQHGFVIVERYIDEAKSATTDRRPAFQQMIADSSNHTFDILLVHKLDRFARNRYDSAVYKRELKKNGIADCSCHCTDRRGDCWRLRVLSDGSGSLCEF